MDVFEDTLFLVMHQTHGVARLHKFGHGNLTTLVSGLNRATDILVVQQNKQTARPDNPCRTSLFFFFVYFGNLILNRSATHQ